MYADTQTHQKLEKCQLKQREDAPWCLLDWHKLDGWMMLPSGRMQGYRNSDVEPVAV